MFKKEIKDKLASKNIKLISQEPVFLNTVSMDLGAIIEIKGKRKTITIKELEELL